MLYVAEPCNSKGRPSTPGTSQYCQYWHRPLGLIACGLIAQGLIAVQTQMHVSNPFVPQGCAADNMSDSWEFDSIQQSSSLAGCMYQSLSLGRFGHQDLAVHICVNIGTEP